MNARVLITRPEGAWPTLAAKFHETRIVLQFTGTTQQLDAVDPRPGDEALERLDRYDWLVATSAQGVSALMRRLAARGVTTLPETLRVAAIGPATAKAFEDAGASVDCVAATASSEGVAVELIPRLSAGASVLLVRPDETAGSLAASLRAASAVVHEAPLYRTVASAHAGTLVDEAIAGRFAAVVFTAPSSIVLWLDAAGGKRERLHEALARVARVAIGPTTSAALDSLGLPASATAETPDEGAVGRAIARVLHASDLIT